MLDVPLELLPLVVEETPLDVVVFPELVVLVVDVLPPLELAETVVVAELEQFAAKVTVSTSEKIARENLLTARSASGNSPAWKYNIPLDVEMRL